MVNDINTLNGSLQALGEKMASNLTTMGVPSTYDEGLNTLADKILQVAPVKTLDHINVELIAGNQILSYADEQQTSGSQYATVRFTAYADAGETETIPNLSLDFQVGSDAVTQVVTDSNGRYEYTYRSEGVGDVEIVASKTVEGIFVSKTYEVEDCTKYISSISHTGGGITLWIDYTLDSLSDVEISADVKSNDIKGFRMLMTNISTPQSSDPVWGEYIGIFSGNAEKIGMSYYDVSPEKTVLSDTTLSTNTFYNLKITYENGVFKGYYNNTLMGTVNITLPSTSKKIGFGSWNQSKTITVKDLKIKPL